MNGPDGGGREARRVSGAGGRRDGRRPQHGHEEGLPQGWCYSDHAEHKAYGSMTAGAIGSLAIWDYIKDNDEGKKRSWKNDKDIHEGLIWLSKNFSVTYNPGPYEHAKMEKDSKAQYLYYMYALERAGMLYGTEVMGPLWYPEGAKVLIETQTAAGSWGDGTIDTCFAILFLKRTRAGRCDVQRGPDAGGEVGRLADNGAGCLARRARTRRRSTGPPSACRCCSRTAGRSAATSTPPRTWSGNRADRVPP